MAKKNKQDDDINEEFGNESSDDINEADDSFGLPDVDYKPLDEVEESSEQEVKQEPQKEPEVFKDTSYRSTTTYEAPKGDSIAPKIILFAILLVISAGVIWYFGFYRPKEVAAEKAKIEAQRKADEAKAAAQRAEQERIAREKAEQERLEREAAEAAKEPEVGEMTTISQRTGRYYVVIGSFVDDDLAKDYANKLATEGHSTSLIPPWGSRKFYRLAITDLDSFDAAQTKADELKPTYGEGLWVLKY